MASLDTPALLGLLDAGPVQIIDVLGADDFAEEHLPGAINIPLEGLGAAAVAELDGTGVTVVYGLDHDCDLAPRAVHRLEALGFSDVHHFWPGKLGWLGEGLAAEGRRRLEQRVAWIAREDVPVVDGQATVADAASSFGPTDDVAVVLGPGRVVLGLLRREALGLGGATPVADVLQPGPSTFRPSMTIHELVGYFRRSHERRAIVTTLGGVWIGLIRREDVLGD